MTTHTEAQAQPHVLCPRCQHDNLFLARFCQQCGAWLGDAKVAAMTQATSMVKPDVDKEHAHDRSVGFYALIFFSLGIATLIEVLSVELVEARGWRLLGIFSMTTVKFLLVALFFMHLRGDKKLYSNLFMLGLFLAATVVLGLFTLFHVYSGQVP